MDAQPDPTSRTGIPASRPLFESAELRAILSHLSHELSRPLISLRAGFDLLLSDTTRPVTNGQRGHVQTMAGLCDDLLRLTRSYLDYAGLVQGARPLRYGTFTLGALIRDVDRQFAATAAVKGIRWECKLEGPDGAVATDASRCQQIFGNLMANALKYTPEGGRVAATGRIEGAKWLVVIADSGPGIPADALSKVFEPFFRLARDEHSGVEGNGLGLAICREMVDQMKGQIFLASTVGQGTRVTVQFPTAAPENHPAPFAPVI